MKSRSRGKTDSGARRTHNLGGCESCKRRHVKCDRVRPECLACRAVGVICEGYTSNIRWMAPSTTSKPQTRQRQRQEKEAVKSNASPVRNEPILHAQASDEPPTETLPVPQRHRGRHQQDIDSVDHLPRNDGFNPNQDCTISSSNNYDEPEYLMDTDLIHRIDSANAAFDHLPHLDYSLQWADLFELDFGNYPIPEDAPHALDSEATIDAIDDAHVAAAHDGNEDTGPHLMQGHQQLNEQPAELLEKAKVLLRHFQDTVIQCMAGLPNRSMSPYKTLNLAAAIQTLADLTFLGRTDISHASLANFYAILACSAHHLATGPSPSPESGFGGWLGIMRTFSDLAKTSLQHSLLTECDGATKAKYKDQLMAILSLTAFSICSGRQKDARRLMLDAERLLRSRGLAKRYISRRMRLLHHVYTWVRIIGESVYVLHPSSAYQQLAESLPSRRPARQADSSTRTHPSGANARLDDFLRLDPSSEDLNEEDAKDPEEGLVDIHLDDPREDSATMYTEIYGLPETWLSLISQTTRLANVMDTWRIGNVEVPTWFRDSVQSRTERLENMVCTFAAKEPDQAPGTPHFHMLRALNAALVIFFYRRIRDVNPFIIQSYVQTVIDALRDFDASLYAQGMLGPGTGWPAYIAACEAASSSARDSLASWLDRAHTKSGMDGFRIAAEVARRVWDQRDRKITSPRSVGSTDSAKTSALCTWVTVCRELETWALVC